MNDRQSQVSGRRRGGVWLAMVVFPLWGLVRVWGADRGLVWRLGLTLVAVVWLPIWLAAALTALIVFTPLELEWDGGFPPIPTLAKTKPNYEAVEASRAKQAIREEGMARKAGADFGYWTGFRGPLRDGEYREMAIRTNWVEMPPVELWRQPVGAGYASFAVAGGLAFTIEQRRQDEAVVAYDVLTGREVWAVRYPALFQEAMGGDGPRATPCVEEGRVYSLGGTGEFRCLEAGTGRVLWGTNILAQHGATNLEWAQSASPLVVGDTVIVCPGGAARRSVVAYDKRTGAVRWTAADEEAAYSSPVVFEFLGERQMVVAVKDKVQGLVPEGADAGRIRWEHPWTVLMNNRNIAQPVWVSTNRFILSAGYGTGSVAVELSREGEGWKTRELWRSKRMKNKFCSSVLRGGHLYGLDEEVLACVDVETGEQKWREGRYGHGQLLLAGDHLIVLSVKGDLALVEVRADRFVEVARVPALEGKTWNYPALTGGILLVRNMVEMAAFDLRPSKGQ